MKNSCPAFPHSTFQHTWSNHHVSTIDHIIQHQTLAYHLLFIALLWCCTSKISPVLFPQSRRSKTHPPILYHQYGRHSGHGVHCWSIGRKCTCHGRCKLMSDRAGDCSSIQRRKRTSRRLLRCPVCCGWIDCQRDLSIVRSGSRLLCGLFLFFALFKDL